MSWVKDPTAVLDYTFDWSEWLLLPDTNGLADTITAATVTADDGITVGTVTITPTGVVVILSGGTAGKSYDIVCHITTAGDRQDQRTEQLDVIDR